MENETFTLQSFEAGDEQADMRLDKLLAVVYPDESRSFFQKLIKSGDVMVNGKDQVKSSLTIQAGDLIEVRIPAAKSVAILPEDIPLDILYEDDDVLVVNKPKNMVVHPAPGHYTGTLVNAILYHCRDSLSGINGEIRPGIVHRIDKDTTGALIVCKNDHAHKNIAEQIKAHSVTRVYNGILQGTLKDEEGTIRGAIGRDPNNRLRMAINEKNGKPAVTHYHVLAQNNGYSLCEFRLETGRTHQIRVHMASIGHPLLGDPLYGPKNPPVKHLEGQCLRLRKVKFSFTYCIIFFWLAILNTSNTFFFCSVGNLTDHSAIGRSLCFDPNF